MHFLRLEVITLFWSHTSSCNVFLNRHTEDKEATYFKGSCFSREIEKLNVVQLFLSSSDSVTFGIREAKKSQ